MTCHLHLMEHCASCSTDPTTRERSNFVGTLPIPGFSPDPWAKDTRVDAHLIDPLNNMVVEDISDGLLPSAVVPSPTKWTKVTLQPEQFPVQVYRNSKWIWVGADRPGIHFMQFVSSHRENDDGDANTTLDVTNLRDYELAAMSATADYTLTAPLGVRV